MEHCENETALRALRMGHVRWEQLHLEVRCRLRTAGYSSECEAAPRPYERQPGTHNKALQHGERWPGAFRGPK